MKYQNTVTGAIIDVKSVISCGNWQALEPAKKPEEKQTVKGKRVTKKDE